MARKPSADDNQPESTRLDAMLADLQDLDIGDLTKLIEIAQGQRETKCQAAREAFVRRVREEAEALELDPAELFKASPPPARTKANTGNGQSRGSVAAKYRGPGGETWSGRGKEPSWLTALIKQGHNKADYLIAKTSNA